MNTSSTSPPTRRWNYRRLGLGLIVLAGAAFLVWWFFLRYRKPDFDKVGGAILAYEVQPQAEGAPRVELGLLVEVLQRRLEEAGLRHVSVRAKEPDRVEIVVPNLSDAVQANAAWSKLVDTMCTRFKVPPAQRPEVSRGRILELADRIHALNAEHLWGDKLLATPQAWERLISKDVMIEDARGRERTQEPRCAFSRFGSDLDNPAMRPLLDALKPGDVPGFYEVLAKSVPDQSERTLRSFIGHHAWHQLLIQVREKYPELKESGDAMERIQPGSIEQMITFIQARGDPSGQAGLALLAKSIGADPLAGAAHHPDRQQARDFIHERYGYGHDEIVQDIQKEAARLGRPRDLELDDRLRIRDLIARTGELEFRVLANSTDDREGIEAARGLLRSDQAGVRDQLRKRADQGSPPPGPGSPDGAKPESFTINLARRHVCVVAYSWVELGPQERRALDLDNAAELDPIRSQQWRKTPAVEGPFQIEQPIAFGSRKALQGALFYKRACKNRNLPAEERDVKRWEYFVLARDPEIGEDGQPGPAVGGMHLIGAYGGQGGDLTPAVHFAFNNTGAELFRQLTRKNVPSGGGPDEVKRHLAIILDGQVMSAPTINSEIGGQGQISGRFTQKEVDSMVAILRAGVLPLRLKPAPVSETVVAPAK